MDLFSSSKETCPCLADAQRHGAESGQKHRETSEELLRPVSDRSAGDRISQTFQRKKTKKETELSRSVRVLPPPSSDRRRREIRRNEISATTRRKRSLTRTRIFFEIRTSNPRVIVYERSRKFATGSTRKRIHIHATL